jgi:hypothetical protein
MKRWLSLAVLVIVLALVTALPASAGRTWCANDPIVMLPSGATVHVNVLVPAENVDDGFTLTLHAPRGSQLQDTSEGMNITVSLVDDGPRRHITASVAAGFPVGLRARYLGFVLPVDESDGGRIFLPPPGGSITWTW